MLMRALATAGLLLGFLSDETRRIQLTCPLDGTQFGAVEVVRSDVAWAWGGLDADFCAHAFKTLPMEHYVWTCPKCHFSGGKAEYDPKNALTDDQKKALLGKLEPASPIRAGTKSEEIPGHVKYDLFAQVLTKLGRPALDVGNRHLHASWAARQAGTAWLDYFDEWVELRTSLGLERSPMELGKENRTDLEFKVCEKVAKEVAGKDVKTTDTLLKKYLLAYSYRKHGENVDALKWLDELAKAKGFNSVVDAGCGKLRASIEVERSHQRKALARFKEAVEKGDLTDAKRAETQFQLGELHRRLGEKAEAVAWYSKCLETAKDEILRKRAEAQKKKAE